MEAIMVVGLRKIKVNKAFPPEKYPELYSKRGFEKKRVKFIIPENRDSLIQMIDSKGRSYLAWGHLNNE